MKKIKRIKLYVNRSKQAEEVKKEVEAVLKENRFELVEDDFDLGIAIGGDGSFLRMVKENDFNSDIFYVGINAGTLGFLQEIRPEQIYEFALKLKNQNFQLEKIGVQETKIYLQNEVVSLLSLNEILIREKDLNTAKLRVEIDGEILEKFVGDGILISTSIGSTAYNLSFGGSIVYSSLHTLQITPVAPLNSRVYRNLLNPVIIPEEKIVTIYPENDKKDLMITVDGDNLFYGNVSKIDSCVREKKIQCLRLTGHSYTQIIHEKFLK